MLNCSRIGKIKLKIFFRFNRFLSDFWKKKKMNIELSAYELADDIKDVVDQYQMPYSYFS